MTEAVCFALLIADRVIKENNGKVGIIGSFNNFNFPAFPATTPPWFIYAGVSNVRGRHNFSMNLTSDETVQVVVPISGEFEVPVDSPNSSIDLIFPLHGVQFMTPGQYTLTLNIDGDQISSRTLNVTQLATQGG